MDHDSMPPAAPARRRGRPPRLRAETSEILIEFSPEAIALGERIGQSIAAGGTLSLAEADLAPVWAGEADRQWRLLRLHRFARTLQASFSREADGSVRFQASPPKARPPHFQFVATIVPGLKNPRDAGLPTV